MIPNRHVGEMFGVEVPPGHTVFSWSAGGAALPPGHTAFSWSGDVDTSRSGRGDASSVVTLCIQTLSWNSVKSTISLTGEVAGLPPKVAALPPAPTGERAPIPAPPTAAATALAPSHLPDGGGEENDGASRKVLSLLTSSLGPPGSSWSTLAHEPTPTSEDSARVRGVSLASGAKAMILSVKPGDDFIMVVISAAEKMDSKKLKKVGQFKSTRFASVEEVMEVTGCVSGAVPPFGSLFGLRTFVDESLQLQGETINFNAGLRTLSVTMSVSDYIATEAPTIVNVH